MKTLPLFMAIVMAAVVLTSCQDQGAKKELECYDKFKVCFTECNTAHAENALIYKHDMDSCWRVYADIMIDTLRVPSKAEIAFAMAHLDCYQNTYKAQQEANSAWENCLANCWTQLDTCVAQAKR